jgi:hypothetical protein
MLGNGMDNRDMESRIILFSLCSTMKTNAEMISKCGRDKL